MQLNFFHYYHLTFKKNFLSCCFIFICLLTKAQVKESIVKASCYVNPELYLNSEVIVFVSTKAGAVACKGDYLTIFNGNKYPFYYRLLGSDLVAVGSAWSDVQPGKQVAIQITGMFTNADSTVPVINLQVKYRKKPDNDLKLKKSALAKMNVNTDKVKAKEIKEKLAADSSSTATLGDSTTNTLTDTVSCFSVPNPAYYTFYYLQVGNLVYYSDPFPVGSYVNEDQGKELLSQAVTCFQTQLKAQLTGDTYNKIERDTSLNLAEGFQGLKLPRIPSSFMASMYPWVASQASAEVELKKWMLYDRNKGTGLVFVKINFPKRYSN
jgi:hypothetical protein